MLVYPLLFFIFEECPIGYFGFDCSVPCDQPFYGKLCSLRCGCLKCHHIYGCVPGKSITINYRCLIYKIRYIIRNRIIYNLKEHFH